MTARKPFPFVLVPLVFAAVTSAAFVVGAKAYTKLLHTTLREEPSPLAKEVASVDMDQALAVQEVHGKWLRVSTPAGTGWVFEGNVADEPPVAIKGADGTILPATETSATAAARPLTSEGKAYAERRNLAQAEGDLEWLIQESGAVSDQDVETYLREHKKGEYQ